MLAGPGRCRLTLTGLDIPTIFRPSDPQTVPGQTLLRGEFRVHGGVVNFVSNMDEPGLFRSQFSRNCHGLIPIEMGGVMPDSEEVEK